MRALLAAVLLVSSAIAAVAAAHVGTEPSFCAEPGTHVHPTPAFEYGACAAVDVGCVGFLCVARVCLGLGFNDTLGPFLWLDCDFWPIPPH